MKVDYKITVEPTAEPVTLKQAKAQCYIEQEVTEHDVWLNDAITAARQALEAASDRALMTKTIELVLDGFPDVRKIELPAPPLQSVTSVQYYDADNALQTYGAANYGVSDYSEPGFIEKVDTADWEATYDRFDAVKITYVAGYASAAAIPSYMKHGVLMIMAELFKNRETTVEQGLRSIATKSATALMSLAKSNARWQ